MTYVCRHNPVLCLRNYWNTLCVRNKWRNMPWKVLVQDHPMIQEMPLPRPHLAEISSSRRRRRWYVGRPRLSYKYVYVIATLRILRLLSIEKSRIYLLILSYSFRSSCFLLVQLASPSCLRATIWSFVRLLSSFHGLAKGPRCSRIAIGFASTFNQDYVFTQLCMP